MWKKSFEILQDHLSPETLQAYGPKEETRKEEAADSVEAASEDGIASETKQEDNQETHDGEMVEDSIPEKRASLSDEPSPSEEPSLSKQHPLPEESVENRAEEIEIHPPEGQEEGGDSEVQCSSTTSDGDGVGTQQESQEEHSKNINQNSLPEEPINDRAEEQEINPPGENQDKDH